VKQFEEGSRFRARAKGEKKRKKRCNFIKSKRKRQERPDILQGKIRSERGAQERIIYEKGARKAQGGKNEKQNSMEKRKGKTLLGRRRKAAPGERESEQEGRREKMIAAMPEGTKGDGKKFGGHQKKAKRKNGREWGRDLFIPEWKDEKEK